MRSLRIIQKPDKSPRPKGKPKHREGVGGICFTMTPDFNLSYLV